MICNHFHLFTLLTYKQKKKKNGLFVHHDLQ